jgi:serine-type D-Ala-D-Ala carboxypeptidase (penicillin-binding protein 5/6)
MTMIYLLGFLTPFLAEFSTSAAVESAILINAETGKIIYEKKAYERRYPASVTKIATALFLLDQKKPNFNHQVIVDKDVLKTATKFDKKKNPEKFPAYTLEPDGTSINLLQNEKISLKTLLYGLMLGSGNDAANALAHYSSGSINSFILELNSYLKKIGCKDTNFLNPHGLHHDMHYTTAFDLAVMTKMALKIPEFAEVVKTITYYREDTNKQKGSVITQTNRIIKPGTFYYDKAYGVKTGYTSNAGFNLVAAAKNEDRNLIAVLLGSKVSENRYKDAISLFEAAFNEKKLIQKIYAKGADIFKKDFSYAKESVKAFLKKDLEVSFYPSEPIDICTNIRWFDKSFPILPDSCVGVLEVLDKNTSAVLQRSELYAQNYVDAKTSYKIIQSISYAGVVLFQHKEGLFVALTLFLMAFILARRSSKKKTI